MKYFLNSIFCLLALSAVLAFQSPSNSTDPIKLTAKVTSCETFPALQLFEFNGLSFKKIAEGPAQSPTQYSFELPATSGPRFYYVGTEASNVKPIILGTEEEVTVSADCKNFRFARTSQSDLNQQYEALKNVLNQHKKEFGQYLQAVQMQERQGNVEATNEAIAVLGELDAKRLHLIDSLKKTSPYLAKVAELNTYLSYQNHGTGDLSEIEYFAKKYFQLVDWNDPDLEYMPWVYEGLKAWVQTIASLRLPVDKQKNFIDAMLSQIPAKSRTHKLALGGIIAGLQARKSSLMSTYAKRYADQFGDSEPEAAAQIAQMLKAGKSFELGGEAPDFSMAQPDGTPLKLSELRGKVVLIDFWASWCGPCRRENPHVVEAYHKYHEKGFDVLGVSLDKTKDRWLQAIEKDGLVWHHVSDLKGWQNSAAKQYGVTSIPHTVLVDAEGKIIARNLRGAALAAKLTELFGE